MIPSGTMLGRYVVGEKLAEGGMAEVYRASAQGAESFKKEVVLKVVLPKLAEDDEFIEMFIAEARLASKLSHPNIVQIFDFGKHEGRYFIAMEYVNGVSLWKLRSRCRKLEVPFPPMLAAAICADVAKGLQYAHSLREAGQSLQVVHRDVTPHNVLLSSDGSVKLTDFGIAKVGTSNTRPGILKGKFPYMSPEQGRGEPVDGRTDVFALGILLWELLAGRRLFMGSTDLEVLRAVQSAPIASPRAFGAHVPEELAAIALKALVRPLDARYQTAAEFERDLLAFVWRNAKGPEETSVAQFLLVMFPPEEKFQSSILPSVLPAPDPPKGTPAPSQPFGTTAPVPGNPPPPKREVRPEPPENPTVPFPDCPEPDAPTGPGTARQPLARARPGPRPLASLDRSPLGEYPRPLWRQQLPLVLDRASPTFESAPTVRGDAFPVAVAEPLSAGADASGAAVKPPRITDEVSVEAFHSIPLRRRLAIGALLTAGGICAAAAFVWFPRAASSAASASIPSAAAAPASAVPAAPAPASTAEPVQQKDEPAQQKKEPVPPSELGTSLAPSTDHDLAKLGAATRDGEGIGLTRSASPAVPPHTSTGRLTVRAVPFAQVVVHGKYLGEVMGTKTYRLAPGTYDVQLTHPTGQVVKPVTIRAGEVSYVEFDARE